MANHLTPSELAREAGLDRRDVIVKCVELGVPIFNGRIDKTLFLTTSARRAGHDRPVHSAPGGRALSPATAQRGCTCAWRPSSLRTLFLR